VKLYFTVRMSARKWSVNATSVQVVYCPGRPKDRAVLQITIHRGKRLSDDQHLAFQNLLAAVKRLQDSVSRDNDQHQL
jgi:hypothetical protein